MKKSFVIFRTLPVKTKVCPSSVILLNYYRPSSWLLGPSNGDNENISFSLIITEDRWSSLCL